MNNYKEYKDRNGESIFILLNNTNSDILDAERQITSMGYIITEMGCLSLVAGVLTAIKARKAQENGLKEAEL